MSALAEISDTAVVAPKPWYQGFLDLDRTQKLRLGLGSALIVAILIGAMVMGRQPEWRILFANVTDKDGGAIIAQLGQMNVPYKYTEGGGSILVPADRVHDTRLRLASQGLPKGATGGFDAMDTNRFGMTQFQERLSFQRGLEGELTRSIQSLSSVQSARVHLAIPNQNGFFREQQKPSASVLLALHPGRILDKNQIAGIVHLVASSVPEMSPAMVSVLDDSGKLLSASPDASSSAVDAQQLQYTQQLEQLYSKRVQEILEPVVGRGNVRAQVTVDVDFSQIESTSESHKPNQTPDSATIRSQQVLEAGPGNGGNAPVPGVPGAVSNQPPAQAGASINGGTPTLAVTGNTGLTGNGRREAVTNYEVDKTVRVVKAATGTVRRLSAAVVVNHKSTTDGQGKTVTKPLTDQQIEQMTALVRDTIGFSKDRGDSVNLMNAAFVTDQAPQADLPLWKQAEVLEAARSFAWPVGMVLLAALIMMGMVRPAIKAATTPPPPPVTESEKGEHLDTLIADVPERPQLEDGTVSETSGLPQLPSAPEHLRLEDAKLLARQNPIAVANIVKTWINGEAPT